MNEVHFCSVIIPLDKGGLDNGFKREQIIEVETSEKHMVKNIKFETVPAYNIAAANLINEIKPKIAVQIHYGSVVGTKEDAEKFVKLLKSTIQWKILIK